MIDSKIKNKWGVLNMGMLDNCRECGYLFVKSGLINICKLCFDKEEVLF